MQPLPPLRKTLLVLSLGLAALPAWAGDDCDAPVHRWQTREALQQWASAQGWQVQRLKIDDGCYEIRGTDAQGRAFKAKIDPETLKVLKMKHRDHGHDRDRDRDRHDERATRPSQAPRAEGTTPPLPAPGATPRGYIE